MAQTITVNGTPMLVSDDISFPFWLESGSSISPEVPVSSISVLEFNIVPNNNGNDMVFNQVISVTEGQTVPEGKTWKVESILMENQGFSSEESNPNFIENGEFQSTDQTGLHINFHEPVLISFSSNIFLFAEILPGGGSQSVSHRGFCFSLDNTSPELSDGVVFGEGGSVGSDFRNNLYVGFDLLPDTTYYIRAFVSNDIGVTYSNTYQISTPNLYVGKSHQGGIICYIDSTNQHGYVIANHVLFNELFLDCYNGETSYDFGSGYSNTQILIEYGCNNDILSILDDYENSTGYNNWFIPSYGEINYVCNLGRVNGSISYSSFLYPNINFSHNGNNWSSFDTQPEDFNELFNLVEIGNHDNYLSSHRHGSYQTLDPGNCGSDGSVDNNNNNLLLFREF